MTGYKMKTKFQIPSTKFQIITNDQNSNVQNINKKIKIVSIIRSLEFGVYLLFACPPAGGEFVIWDFRRWARSTYTSYRLYIEACGLKLKLQRINYEFSR